MTHKRSKSGFTMTEILIASAISTLVIFGAISVYLYISKDGKALNAQVEFNSLASVLEFSFVNEIEPMYCVRVDHDGLGVKLCASGQNPDDEDIPWIGYAPGDTTKDCRIVFHPHGKESDENERTLCNWVSRSDNPRETKMFRPLSGIAVQLSVHIGDGPNPEDDVTGPGRQGVNLTVVGSCHDIRR